MPHNSPWYEHLRNYCSNDKAVRDTIPENGDEFNWADITACFKEMRRDPYTPCHNGGLPAPSSFFSKINALSNNGNRDKYTWGVVESLFFNKSYHVGNDRFFYEFGFYASAAIMALKILIKTCDKENKVPYIFIVTTQSPIELMYTEANIDDGLGFYSASAAYTRLFREAILDRRKNQSPLIVERHVLFGEDNLRHRYAREYGILKNRNHVENSLPRDPTKTEPRNPTKTDFNLFFEWVNNNHSNMLGEDVKNKSFAYEVKTKNLPAKHIKPNSGKRYVDLIVFGVGELKENADQTKYVKTDWQFGLGVIEPIERSQARFVNILTQSELKRTQCFLGLDCADNFDEFVKSLQGMRGSQGGSSASFLKLGPSKRLIDIPPWKEWWEAVDGKKNNPDNDDDNQARISITVKNGGKMEIKTGNGYT